MSRLSGAGVPRPRVRRRDTGPSGDRVYPKLTGFLTVAAGAGPCSCPCSCPRPCSGPSSAHGGPSTILHASQGPGGSRSAEALRCSCRKRGCALAHSQERYCRFKCARSRLLYFEAIIMWGIRVYKFCTYILLIMLMAWGEFTFQTMNLWVGSTELDRATTLRSNTYIVSLRSYL